MTAIPKERNQDVHYTLQFALAHPSMKNEGMRGGEEKIANLIVIPYKSPSMSSGYTCIH